MERKEPNIEALDIGESSAVIKGSPPICEPIDQVTNKHARNAIISARLRTPAFNVGRTSPVALSTS